MHIIKKINNYKSNNTINSLEYPIPGEFFERAVIVPNEITVHLGAPDEIAENVTVPFIDYIKNVASSELYPTWPENALRANIHAIVSVALNRIFTEWYRGRGYDFDITNSPQYDQSFVYNRGTYENVNNIVDEIFNQYIVAEGRIEPLYALFCDGRTTQCNGLSQWGTVDLAEQEYSPIEILRYYFGNNININTAPVGESIYRYPGRPLTLGDSGFDVLRKELQLDRISVNFPAIPKISPIDGYFDESTEAAVRKFQEVFNLPVTGEIDQGTWYKIFYIYNAVTKLSEVTSEGLLLEQFEEIVSEELLRGDVRPRVTILQYFLTVLSLYYESIPEVPITSIFDDNTRNAVIEFQKTMGLEPTGIVDTETWDILYRTVLGILDTLPPESTYLPYLRYTRDFNYGDIGPDIFILQEMLQYISLIIPEIPTVTVNENFDDATLAAVKAFQSKMNLEPTGIVDETTWNTITEVYRAQRYGGVSP